MGQNYTFYERIRNLAKQQGITVARMERDLGIETQAKKWNKFMPNVSTLMRLADYFGVTVDSLLGRESVTPPEEFDMLVKYRQLTPAQKEQVLSFIQWNLDQSPVKKESAM